MANIKLKNIYICENVIIAFNGQLSLINIIPEITSTAFPAIHPKLTVLVNTIGDEGSYEEKVEIISVNESKTIAVINGKVEIKGPGGNNFIATFINTVFSQEGKYWIKVSINGEVVSNEFDHFVQLKKV